MTTPIDASGRRYGLSELEAASATDHLFTTCVLAGRSFPQCFDIFPARRVKY